MTKQPSKNRLALDWRVVFGIVVTSVWLLTGLIYLSAKVGFGTFSDLPVGEIGSFLEGAFAPLAFLWLVIGHFMQQSEISANTVAMQSQEQSIKRQELHSRRDGFFKLLELVQSQLGSIAGFHYISVVGSTGTEEVSNEEYAELRSRSANGDPALFVRRMVSMAAQARGDTEKMEEIFLGTEIRQRHSNNFEQTFEKILKAANEVDHQDLIENAL
ncbi:MAG: hypothetical protein AAF197_06195, partial [Pseudomonadota bacterium]